MPPDTSEDIIMRQADYKHDAGIDDMSPEKTDERVGTKPNNDDDNYVGTASSQFGTEPKDNPTGSEG